MIRRRANAHDRRRRWYQFHLSHLLAIVTIAAIACSWLRCKMERARLQKEAVESLIGVSCDVYYDYECDADGNTIPDAPPPGPEWLRDLVGIDFLADVVRIECRYFLPDEAGFEHLHRLKKLRWFYLFFTSISGCVVEQIQYMT